MKTNAIVRIILFSLAIILLTGILLAGITFNLFRIDTNSGGTILTTASDGSTTVSIADIADIDNIDIEWAAGSITIQSAGGLSEIRISETAVSDSKHQMVCEQSGSTLKIRHQKDTANLSLFGGTTALSKDLVIYVPEDWVCGVLKIDAAAAQVTVSNMMIREVSFDGASGVCIFDNCAVEELDLETASGDIRYSGTLNILDCDAASANCHITANNVPQRIDLESASGNLELELPDYCGFTCHLDTLSGRYYSDFQTNSSNSSYVYGDGGCEINVSALSGDIRICKNESCSSATVVPHESSDHHSDKDGHE